MESKKIFETKIIELQNVLSKISEIEIKVKVFKGKIKDFDDEIDVLLSVAGISPGGHLKSGHLWPLQNRPVAGQIFVNRFQYF